MRSAVTRLGHGRHLTSDHLTPIAIRYYSTRLAEVGKFEEKLADENCYPPGQSFLHRIFGYRGVTLFPWLARVHDVDLRKQYSDTSGTLASAHRIVDSSNLESHKTSDKGGQSLSSTSRKRQKSKPSSSSLSSNDESNDYHDDDYDHIGRTSAHDESRANKFTNPQSTRFHPYYQVLIDTRDCPFVSNRTQTEAVTFLGHPDNSKSVYSIKGLDYVAHEDILPYTSYEETPIRHELHKKLFKYNPDAVGSKYTPSDLLDSWRSKHPWLELSRVYKETTENVRVTVIPFYLGHTTIEDTSFHWWRYCVRLENFSEFSVQLRERHWKIFSQTNMLQTIKGRGVVGVEPLLTKGEPAYQYSSHVNLQDRSGHMWGTFKMQREDGYTFECRIPPFSLESSLNSSPNTAT
uniref:Polymerase delta-interacting protein 2 n=1 Tax=Aceria tosichella TaxID=561515 RepID=A0A6G1SCA6_9ACAR